MKFSQILILMMALLQVEVRAQIRQANLLTADKRIAIQTQKLPVPKNVTRIEKIADKDAQSASTAISAETLKKYRVYHLETAKQGGVDLGGGVTVEINNRPALRDLVDKTVCKWISGPEFQKQFVPDSKTVVDKIKKHHWYLGDLYERQINEVIVCLTEGPLKKIPDQDLDAVTIYPYETRQAAIRAGQMIFVDMSVFRRMLNQLHRDFLFIHEITHSFIPFDPKETSRRYESLRSFVRMLSEDFDANTLSLNITANQLDVPTTTEEIEIYKKEILGAFDEKLPLSQRAVFGAKLTQTIASLLWAGDRRNLLETSVKYLNLSSRIRTAILQEDFKLLASLYSTYKIEPQARLFVAYQDKCYYFPTSLELALHTCGKVNPELLYQPQVVHELLTVYHYVPSIDEIRYFINRTLNLTSRINNWNRFWIENPHYQSAIQSARELVDNIPPKLLRTYLNNKDIQSSEIFSELIEARLQKTKN